MPSSLSSSNSSSSASNDYSKDSCDFSYLGYLDYEQFKKKLMDFPIVVRLVSCTDTMESVHRSASSTETIQKTLGLDLDDEEASVCSERGEESALHEPP